MANEVVVRVIGQDRPRPFVSPFASVIAEIKEMARQVIADTLRPLQTGERPWQVSTAEQLASTSTMTASSLAAKWWYD